MGFGGTAAPSDMAKTQADIVAERIEAKPKMIEEEVVFPGLQKIHLMGEGELVEFLTMILKSRVFIRELSLTLGEDYKCTEKQITIPKSNMLHTLSFSDVARVLTMALASGGDTCIGFRAIINVDKEGDIASRLYCRTTDKPVHGPMFDEDGNVMAEGDPEFSPKMVITSKP
jgi:hypothetical protein